MLQRLSTLSGGLRAVGGPRAALPALARHARMYGFGSHVSDNDPELMEREKQRHLKGQTISHIKQVPGWSERLASDSEAVVKAEHECPDCPMEEMQQQTIETLKAEEEADATSFGGNAPPSGALGNA